MTNLKNSEQLLDYLDDKYLLVNNVVFLQGLFLAANAPELYKICLEYAKKEERKMHFFEEKILENGKYLPLNVCNSISTCHSLITMYWNH